MASKQAVAIQREQETERLVRAVARIGRRLGLDAATEYPTTGRDPEMVRNAQLAWVADAVEAIDGALKSADFPADGSAAQRAKADLTAALGARGKPEKGPMSEAKNKPNKGQDEHVHTFVNDAGEERTGTMREFRDSLKGQGFRKPDDADDGDATPMPPAAPVAPVE